MKIFLANRTAIFYLLFRQPRPAVFYQINRIKPPLIFHNEKTNPPTKKPRLKHALTTLALLSGLAALTTSTQTVSGETNSQPPMPPLWSILEDADQDGMTDVDELLWGMDPFNPEDGLSDLDGDEISLAWEFAIGTNPDVADTDTDDWSDSEEYLLYGTDPLDPLSFPQGDTPEVGGNSASTNPPSVIPEAEAVLPPPPPPSLSNGDFSNVGITTWKSMLSSKEYQGGGFKWNAGAVDSWTAYAGTTVEVWDAGGEKFVELDGSPGNYGIKQEIANVRAGGYVLAWRQSGRNSTRAGTDPYCLRVYYMNGTSEVPIAQSTEFTNLDKMQWKDNVFAFQITPAQLTAAGTKPVVYVAFIPTGTLNTYGTLIDKVSILPMELISDLNNDGQITSADDALKDSALKSGASASEKEKGTEYIFKNDKMSNGVWDVDDDGLTSYSYGWGYGKMPKPPATHKDDDDAEPLKIKVGLTTGKIWFEHPTAAKLEFFKTPECKATDKLSISSSAPFDLSADTLPETVYIRLRDDWQGGDAEGDLRMFVGKDTSEIWAELKLPLTAVEGFGDKHFFNAARDYIMENNTRLCIRDLSYPFGAADPTTIWRLCVMREEATKLTTYDAYSKKKKGISEVGSALLSPTVVINGNQCFWTAGWDENSAVDILKMATNIADKCHGRAISGGVTASISSDNFDTTTRPAKGSPLAGPDPIPVGLIAGPDGIAGTTDDIANPQAGDPGGKFVGLKSGIWNFAAGRATGTDALGGLSTNYASLERADKAHQMIGFWKALEVNKGCVFTATQIKGVGGAPGFARTASGSEVPVLAPSVDTGAIKLFILDCGAGSLALMHTTPAGTLQGAYIGRKSELGIPYYVNTYLALDSTAVRP